mmetsp:Transcript_15384/g.20222  ORF Transcript_15384/g.20222 Transcript_15384/m.20222 type:complete len:128 (-) Transcript_15384:553-936(-)
MSTLHFVDDSHKTVAETEAAVGEAHRYFGLVVFAVGMRFELDMYFEIAVVGVDMKFGVAGAVLPEQLQGQEPRLLVLSQTETIFQGSRTLNFAREKYGPRRVYHAELRLQTLYYCTHKRPYCHTAGH